MKRIVLATTIALAFISASGQEQQDSLKSVSMMQELQEVVVKGNLPNTRLKGNAMITRIQGTPLSDAGTLGEMLVKVPGMTGTDETPEVLGKGSPLIYINGRLMRDNSELKRLLKDNSLTLRAAVLDCLQRNRMNEFSDCGYNQIQQNNRFSTHKLMFSVIYRLNATRSKYKGTGAGREAQARMGS